MKNSLQTRLTFFVVCLVAVLLTITVSATLSLVYVDRKFESVDEEWLASTAMLGELADRLTEFRLAETYRALANSNAGRQQAERLALDHRVAIGNIIGDYLRLNSEIGGSDLRTVISTWNSYLRAHDDWVRRNGEGNEKGPAEYASTLHDLYVDADDAVDSAIDLNANRSHADAAAVDKRVHVTITLLLLLSLAGTGVALWLLYKVRNTITKPLAEMTRALSSLAQGREDVKVPELNRTDEVGKLANAFEVFRANAVALEQAHKATRAAQLEAQAMARHDALTGLPNRRLFGLELDRLMERHAVEQKGLSLLMIDLDRFKPINDTLGHAAGDHVLGEVARRLKDAVSKGEIAARLGGDEFAVLISEADDLNYTDGIARYAEKLLRAISAPIYLADTVVEIGASIGIAVARSGASTPEQLLRAADLAMYRAKKEGRGRFCFFEPAMDEEMRVKAAMESDLRNAIKAGEIKPFYQPLVNIKQGDVYGFEMLARWKHPKLGDIRPDTFIALAEQLGLIGDLTWSLLARACEDACSWGKKISLSINISPIQLTDPSFPLQLLGALNHGGFDPTRLEVEVTESAFLSDIETARNALATLQGWGIKIALDDFGTGYSSLSHLRQLKFDKIKIDRSFVQTINQSAENQKIVSAILSLADSLNLPTVAEGIESDSVMQQLEEMGCQLGQGYLFGKAIPADKVADLLSNQGTMQDWSSKAS